MCSNHLLRRMTNCGVAHATTWDENQAVLGWVMGLGCTPAMLDRRVQVRAPPRFDQHGSVRAHP